MAYIKLEPGVDGEMLARCGYTTRGGDLATAATHANHLVRVTAQDRGLAKGSRLVRRITSPPKIGPERLLVLKSNSRAWLCQSIGKTRTRHWMQKSTLVLHYRPEGA